MDGPRRIRVAVVGARGFGRHHANWWRVEGAEVCAVLGRTPDSARAATDTLRDRFGITAQPYADFGALASAERPDVYDVCSPPEVHGAHAGAALEAGGDVLCEKPLCFDETRPAADLRGEAEALVTLAARHGRRLALCSQYAVVAAEMRALAGVAGPVRHFAGHLCSPAAGRPPDPARTWIDLGPHLLAALQAAAPGARPAPDSLRVRAAGHRADVSFRAGTAGGGAVDVDFTVDHSEGPPGHVRRFAFDGCAFDLAGEPGTDGHYGARYTGEGVSVARPDPLRLLIRDFLAGRDRLDAAAALENERALLAIRERLAATA